MAIVPQSLKTIKMTRLEQQLATAKIHYDNLVYAAKTGQRWLDAEKPQLELILKSYGLRMADFTSNSWVERSVLDGSKYFFNARVKCETGPLTARRCQNLQNKLKSASVFRVGYVGETGFTLSKRII